MISSLIFPISLRGTEIVEVPVSIIVSHPVSQNDNAVWTATITSTLQMKIFNKYKMTLKKKNPN